MKNKRIAKIIKKQWNAVLITNIVLLICIAVLYLFARVVIGNQLDLLKYVNYILYGLIALWLVTDIVFYFVRINYLKKFHNIKPLKGIIEDFIIISYIEDGCKTGTRIKHVKCPVVKVDNKLYFTYGNYTIQTYNEVWTKMNNLIKTIDIIRDDKTKVNIGDEAYVYIDKNVNVNINIDTTKNIFRLNNKKCKFINFNTKNNISIINNMLFYKGIVDFNNSFE